MPSFNLFHWRQTVAEFDEVDLERRERCIACDAPLEDDAQYARLRVCSTCDKHYLFPAGLRIRSLVDNGTFRETHRNLVTTDPLGFADERRYVDVRDELWSSLRLADSLTTGTARLDGHEIVLAVIDFRFLGGSMGVVAGEKLVRAAELSLKRRRPLLSVVATGGARMQEGMVSLLQMARTASAIERLREAGVPYLSVLTSPTTGGVLASFASLGDVILAEPDALIGFAGPRVVEELLGTPLPPESHSAEFLVEHGLIDDIVHREDLRKRLAAILDILAARGKAAIDRPRDLFLDKDEGGDEDAWELVQIVRDPAHPTTIDIIDAICDCFVELHGDRQSADDPAVVAGIGTITGRAVAIAGFERGNEDEAETRRFGRPMPAGYRKIQRLMRLAARLRLPIVTMIDTPGAYPGIEAERTGLAREIAETLALASSLPTPIVALVAGEGGSGGALALAVSDRLYMLERSFFSVIAPEAAAAILYRNAERAPELARKMEITPRALLRLGLIDGIIRPAADPSSAFEPHAVCAALVSAIDELEKKKASKLIAERRERYRKLTAHFVRNAPRRRPSPPSSPLLE
jgi:acetyl-CoA carboxylase carboxyl transferase subunit beta